jgi:hypothetical protein
MLDSIFTTFYVSENSSNSAPVLGKNPAIIGESSNTIFHPDEALEIQILNIPFSDVKKEMENDISKIIGKITSNKTIKKGQFLSKKAKKNRKKIFDFKNEIMNLENLLKYERIEDIHIFVLGKNEVLNYLENKGIINSKICGLIKKLFFLEYIKRYAPGYIREGMDSEDWYSLGARSYSWFYEKNKPSMAIEHYREMVIARKLLLNVRFIGFYLRSLIVNQTQRDYDDVDRRMYYLSINVS